MSWQHESGDFDETVVVNMRCAIGLLHSVHCHAKRQLENDPTLVDDLLSESSTLGPIGYRLISWRSQSLSNLKEPRFAI
jgi:hypothetical protein